MRGWSDASSSFHGRHIKYQRRTDCDQLVAHLRHKTYFRPQASNNELVKVYHYAIIIYAVVLAS